MQEVAVDGGGRGGKDRSRRSRTTGTVPHQSWQKGEKKNVMGDKKVVIDFRTRAGKNLLLPVRENGGI